MSGIVISASFTLQLVIQVRKGDDVWVYLRGTGRENGIDIEEELGGLCRY